MPSPCYIIVARMAFSYNDIAQTEVGGGRALPGQQAVAELRFGTSEGSEAQLPASEGMISNASRESLASDHPGRLLLIRAREDAIELSAPAIDDRGTLGCRFLMFRFKKSYKGQARPQVCPPPGDEALARRGPVVTVSTATA